MDTNQLKFQVDWYIKEIEVNEQALEKAKSEGREDAIRDLEIKIRENKIKLEEYKVNLARTESQAKTAVI